MKHTVGRIGFVMSLAACLSGLLDDEDFETLSGATLRDARRDLLSLASWLGQAKPEISGPEVSDLAASVAYFEASKRPVQNCRDAVEVLGWSTASLSRVLRQEALDRRPGEILDQAVRGYLGSGGGEFNSFPLEMRNHLDRLVADLPLSTVDGAYGETGLSRRRVARILALLDSLEWAKSSAEEVVFDGAEYDWFDLAAVGDLKSAQALVGALVSDPGVGWAHGSISVVKAGRWWLEVAPFSIEGQAAYPRVVRFWSDESSGLIIPVLEARAIVAFRIQYESGSRFPPPTSTSFSCE